MTRIRRRQVPLEVVCGSHIRQLRPMLSLALRAVMKGLAETRIRQQIQDCSFVSVLHLVPNGHDSFSGAGVPYRVSLRSIRARIAALPDGRLDAAPRAVQLKDVLEWSAVAPSSGQPALRLARTT